jgi:hypothetical protein
MNPIFSLPGSILKDLDLSVRSHEATKWIWELSGEVYHGENNIGNLLDQNMDLRFDMHEPDGSLWTSIS